MTSKGMGGTAQAMVVMQRTYSAVLEWEARGIAPALDNSQGDG